MASIEELSQEVEKIKLRNKIVETNKAWEISLTRKVLIAGSTYLAIGLYLNLIQVARPWVNAIIPTVGFLFSTFTLPFFKSLWEKYIYKN